MQKRPQEKVDETERTAHASCPYSKSDGRYSDCFSSSSLGEIRRKKRNYFRRKLETENLFANVQTYMFISRLASSKSGVARSKAKSSFELIICLAGEPNLTRTPFCPPAVNVGRYNSDCRLEHVQFAQTRLSIDDTELYIFIVKYHRHRYNFLLKLYEAFKIHYYFS